jgi:mycothiol synthase
MEDLDITAGMFEAVDRALYGEVESWNRAFLEETWRSSFVDLPTMTQLVLDPDATVAGYGELESVEPASSIDAFIRVHPGHMGRGIGTWLIGWAEVAASRLVPAGADSRLWSWLASVDSKGLDLVRSRGYRRVRTFWHMRMKLDALEQIGPPPPGIIIRGLIEGTDERSVHEVLDGAFADHFGYVSIPFDRWLGEFRGSTLYDPAMILVAEEDGQIVGVSTQFENQGVGWVGELGVRPTHQGRGIGRALLRHALEDLARRGLRTAQLNVDSENERGATRLYESVGMSVLRSWPVFEKRITGTKLPA